MRDKEHRTMVRGGRHHRFVQLTTVAVLGLFLLHASLSWGRPSLGLLTDALILAIAATGLNLISGYTGQVSIGHSAFFGLGAYTTAVLIDAHGWSPGWTLIVSAVACSLAGVALSLPALRLRGVHLTLVTLSFGVVFPVLLGVPGVDEITGGPNGIKGLTYLPPAWTPFDGRADLHRWIFWLAVAGVVLVTFIASNLVRGRFGRAMAAVRDNDTAAAAMGVDVARLKTLVFALSAAMTGLAGSLFALKLTLVDPTVQMFTFIGGVFLLLIVIVGGQAQTLGPLVGATVFVYVRDWATTVGEANDIDGLGGLVFGVGLIAVVFVAPGGIVGLLAQVGRMFVRVVPQVPAAGAQDVLASMGADGHGDSPLISQSPAGDPAGTRRN